MDYQWVFWCLLACFLFLFLFFCLFVLFCFVSGEGGGGGGEGVCSAVCVCVCVCVVCLFFYNGHQSVAASCHLHVSFKHVTPIHGADSVK